MIGNDGGRFGLGCAGNECGEPVWNLDKYEVEINFTDGNGYSLFSGDSHPYVDSDVVEEKF